MENSIKYCAVPYCESIAETRDVCPKHYQVWASIFSNYEEIAPYVNESANPRRKCSHERTGSNVLIKKNGHGTPVVLCKKCRNSQIRERKRAKKLNDLSS